MTRGRPTADSPPGDPRRGGRPRNPATVKPRKRMAEEARGQAAVFTAIAEKIDAGQLVVLDAALLDQPVHEWSTEETARYLRFMACGLTPTELNADERFPRFNLTSFNHRWLHDSAFRIEVRAARSAAALHEQDEALLEARKAATGDMAYEGRRKTLTGVLLDRAAKHNAELYGQKVALKVEGEISVRAPGLRSAGEAALAALLETQAPLLEGRAEPVEGEP